MVKACFKRNPRPPSVTYDPFIWDWKAWLTPCMRDIARFKDFRAFKFLLNARDEVAMFYKTTITSTKWNGFNGSLREGN